MKSTIQHFAPAGGTLLGTLAASGENKARDTETLIDGPHDRYTLHDGRQYPCRFIIGDEVRYKQQKAFLVLRDADGRKCRLQIVAGPEEMMAKCDSESPWRARWLCPRKDATP